MIFSTADEATAFLNSNKTEQDTAVYEAFELKPEASEVLGVKVFGVSDGRQSTSSSFITEEGIRFSVGLRPGMDMDAAIKTAYDTAKK